MKKNALFEDLPGLPALLANADHVDVKTITADVSMRAFIAGMLAYNPGWIKGLYRLRWGFIRLLGMKQNGIPQAVHMRPEDVPMTPGDRKSVV